MRRKFTHSLLGMTLVAATVAAPGISQQAAAQGSWSGFDTISVPTDLREEGALNDAAGWGAGVTNDLGGEATDLWVNNHASRSEALIDFVGGTSVFNELDAAPAGLSDTHGVTWTDIDGDGDEDLIETMGRDHATRVRINTNGVLGAPNEATGMADSAGRGRQSIPVDIDNDGDMDILMLNLLRVDNPSPSALYINNNGTFTAAANPNGVLTEGENLRYAQVTSTGPGEPPIIVTSNNFSFGVDSIRTNESGLVAVANGVTQTVGADDNATHMRDIALGDLDGDLVPEWVAARQDDFLATDDENNGVDEEGEPLPPGDGNPDLEGELAIGIGQVSVNGNDTIDNLVDVSSDALADNCRAVSLADFDNDGDLDIFGGCTMVETEQDRNIVLLNAGDGINFTIAAESLVPATAAKTAVVVVNADFNNDGWIDTYVGGGHDNEAGDTPIDGTAEDHIFLNKGGSNSWLKVDLNDPDNPDAAGAQVFVGTNTGDWQVRESGHRMHRGQDMRELHFGLGAATAIAPVEIQWPDGTFERCSVAGISQTVTITKGGDNCEAQTKTGLLANLDAAPDMTEVNPPAPEVLCNGLVVTVNLALDEVPTEGDDVIRGTAGADVINALGGDDIICGLQGDDTINAGDGFDKVFAGAGNDTINGGTGNDFLVGGDGDDTIFGGNGNDRLQGGLGADDLNGDGGSDRIAGNNGNDILRGGTHTDKLFGNLGRDQLFGEGGNDVLRGGAWKDIMNGGAGNDDGCTLSDPGGLVETRIDCEAGVFGR